MELRVGTFNIQHGKDYRHFKETGEHRIDLALMAETVRAMGVDLCGLNEVYHLQGEASQAEQMARQLGWYSAFVPAINIKNGTYGNGLISRFPITSVRAVPIVTLPGERGPEPHYEDRVLLIAEIEAEGRRITVMVCHFGLNGPEMDKATATVRNEAKAVTTPLIFMGDLNLTPENHRIQELKTVFSDSADVGEGAMLTFPSDRPGKKIDYIFGKACEFISAEVPALVASDHLPVKAAVQV